MISEDMIQRDMRAFWTPFLFGAAAVLFFLGHLQVSSRVIWKNESPSLVDQPLAIQIALGLVVVAGCVMIIWHHILRPSQNLTSALGRPYAWRIKRALALSALSWSPFFAFTMLFASGGGEIWTFAQFGVFILVWLLFSIRRQRVVERLFETLDHA